MSLISDRTRGALRGIQNDNFPHRCRLEAKTDGPLLPTGGRAVEWIPYAQNVPCRMSPVSGTEVPRGLNLSPETNFRLVLPFGQAVAPADRAVVTGETNGVAWEETIGFTYIDVPKAESSATFAYGTTDVQQVGEDL